MPHAPRPEDGLLSRREFLQRCGIGMGGLGLALLTGAEAQGAAGASAVNLNTPLMGFING